MSMVWRATKRFVTTDWVQLGHDLWTFSWFIIGRFMMECPQAAAALTYTALLALVPLTTITVGIISGFPAFQDLQLGFRDLVFSNLVPEVGAAVLDSLQGFAANAGSLTGFGVVGLIVTSVMLLSTIEGAFNAIWRVNQSRSWLIRLLSFWAILTLTPILAVSSLSLTSQLHFNSGVDDDLLRPLMSLLPLLFEFIGFTALYWLIPNRSVKASDAMVGAAVAAVLFEIAKGSFGWYLRAFPVYQTVYGALATIPIFLVWLYVAWSILLLGAMVAAGLPDWRAGKLIGSDVDKLLPAQRLTMACAVLRVLLEASRLGTRIRRKTLLNRVPIGGAMMDGILDQLRQAHFVERGQSDGWLLSRDLGTATLYDLERSLGIGLRGATGTIKSIEGQPWERYLMELLRDADQAHQEILGLRLVEVLEPPPPTEISNLRRDRRNPLKTGG